MKNYFLILGGVIALMLAAKTFVQVEVPSSNSNLSNYQFSQESKTDSFGEVDVVVTPLSINPGEETKFTVTLNTHSVELSYDLVSISKLTDDKNRQANPVSWDGGKGGHHLKGTLAFPAVLADTTEITLTIQGVAGRDRVFTWSKK